VKKIWRFIVAVLLLGGWSVAALSLHVVRTSDRWVVVPKNTIGVTDTYADARSWTLNDAASHPALVRRLIEAGKTHTLDQISDLKPGQDVETQLVDAIKRGPTTAPSKPVVNGVTQGHPR